MRILVTGSRDWNEVDAIREALIVYKTEHNLALKVCSGGAPGADKLAEMVCIKKLGIDFVTYHPNWEGRGKPAGPIRNRFMLDEFLRPEIAGEKLVLAFHDALELSKGTKDMCKYALQKNIPVLCFNSHGESRTITSLD